MLKDTDLVEQCLDSKIIYQGDFLTLKKDQIRQANGHVTSREYVQHPGAAVVVPVDNDGCVWLAKQFRYPVGQVLLEFPAGKLDQNEQPLDCAKRELQEETGITATSWAYAGKMHLAVGYSDEVIHIFFAKDLQHGATNLDVGEQIELIKMPTDELFDYCQQGKITDAKTLACCFWLQNILTDNWKLQWM